MHISKKLSALQREIYRFFLFSFCLSLVFSLSACDDDEERGCSFDAEIYVLDSYQRNEESCTPGGEELLGTDQAQVSHALLTCGEIFGFIIYQARSCSSLEVCERAREDHLNDEFPDFDDVEGEFSAASTSSSSSSSDNCATVDYSEDRVTRSGGQLTVVIKEWTFTDVPTTTEDGFEMCDDEVLESRASSTPCEAITRITGTALN